MTKKKNKYIGALVEIITQTYREWKLDSTLRLGAGIAYYGIIAIVPVTLLSIGIAEFFFSSTDITQFLEQSINEVLGDKAGDLLPEIESRTSTVESQGLYGLGLFGIGSLMFSATLIFLALQDALAAIWKTQRGLKFSIKRYVVPFLVMLISGATFTILLTAHAVVTFADAHLPDDVAVFSLLTNLLSAGITFAIGTLLIMMLLKFFIRVKTSASDLFIGSIIIAAFMHIGFYGVGFYISNFASQSLSGALGGLMLILLWIYYMAQIFLAGTQFTKVLSYRSGSTYLKSLMKRSDPRIHPSAE